MWFWQEKRILQSEIYQDGDSEEYNKEEKGTMLHKAKRNTNILQEILATKHEHIIEEHATMETIYTSLSQFSGGFAKAMKCTEMMVLKISC